MRSLSGAFWLAGAVIGAAPACAQLPDIILSGVAIKATPSLSIVSDPGRPVLGTRIEGSILIQLTYGCRQAAEPSSRVRRVGLRMARPVF